MLVWLLAAAQGATAGVTIRASKHNLSAGGTAAVRATSESEICIFCHTPHTSRAMAPMWNRPTAGTVYLPYSSSTAKALVGQPTGASKLCLGCHDGTIAPGMLLNRTSDVRMLGLSGGRISGAANLGRDLSDDHPVSFVYDSALAARNGALRDPSALMGVVRLDRNHELQCTTCHDPHSNQYDKMLVMNNKASALCEACHTPQYWNTSIHRNSAATWNGVQPNPWTHTRGTSVAANGCENCHRPHSAGTRQRLLNLAGEAANCYACHDGNVAPGNIQAEFAKPSTHPVTKTSGLHDPAEDPIRGVRHVACSDCHNPHAARTATARAPDAPGGLAGVKGVSSAGTLVDPLTKEYELCFRCHGDSADRGSARVPRQWVQTNVRVEFQPSGRSYHPVETSGRNAVVPSLISPWTTASLVYCTDCHNNNQGPQARGNGPNGPHGSAYAPLLERRLEFADDQAESADAYALCYKCHSRSSLLGDESFPFHRKHVVDARTACTTCHDSHGVESVPHLINFNTTYVSPYDGQMRFTDEGPRHASCQLTCHEKPHTGTGVFRY